MTVFTVEYNKGCHECALQVKAVAGTLDRAVTAATAIIMGSVSWKEVPPEEEGGQKRWIQPSYGASIEIVERVVLS